MEHFIKTKKVKYKTGFIWVSNEVEPQAKNKLLILRSGLLWGKEGQLCTFLWTEKRRCGILSHNNINYTAECDIRYAIERGDVAVVIAQSDLCIPNVLHLESYVRPISIKNIKDAIALAREGKVDYEAVNGAEFKFNYSESNIIDYLNLEPEIVYVEAEYAKDFTLTQQLAQKEDKYEYLIPIVSVHKNDYTKTKFAIPNWEYDEK